MLRFRNKIPTLDAASRETLNRVVRSRTIPVAIYRRAYAILLIAYGYRPGEVARRVGLDRVNVFRWVKRFRTEGVSCLSDQPIQRRGEPEIVTTPECEPSPPLPESSLAATLRQLAERQAKWAND